MTRLCFNCKRKLTVDEAADGQLALDEVVEAYPDFEGWVHCDGPDDEFVQEDDTELEEACNNIDAVFEPLVIQICRPCVVQKWAEEKGIEENAPYNRDLQEFHKFIQSLNKGRK